MEARWQVRKRGEKGEGKCGVAPPPLNGRKERKGRVGEWHLLLREQQFSFSVLMGYVSSLLSFIRKSVILV